MNVKAALRLAVLVCLAPVLSVSARAELSDVVVLFVNADHNGDRFLSKAEVIATGMLQFNQVDGDLDGQLEKSEVADLAENAEFSDNDADKSGSLSLKEVIDEKLADFQSADTDRDGKLSYKEVKDFYDKQE